MELALWCDLRVVERSAVMGVYCRRWGVPLIDGGTWRPLVVLVLLVAAVTLPWPDQSLVKNLVRLVYSAKNRNPWIPDEVRQ